MGGGPLHKFFSPVTKAGGKGRTEPPVAPGDSLIHPVEEWLKELSFEESICWTLDCFESDLDELYWRYSYGEFVARVRRKIGEYTTSHLQAAHGLIKVVGMAFGGGKPKENIIDDPEVFNRMMRGE